MNKILLLTSFTFYLFVLCSCNHVCIQTHLTKDDMAWGKSYDSGQLVLFKSNLNNIDTFVVDKYTYTSSMCNPFELGIYQYEELVVRLIPAQCSCGNDNCTITMRMMRDENNGKELPTIGAYGNTSAIHTYTTYGPGPDLQTKDITLSTTNMEYPEAYFVQERIYGLDGRCLKSVYWDKKDGLVRFTTMSDEVFDFLQKMN